jgi:hypothetical protein
MPAYVRRSNPPAGEGAYPARAFSFATACSKPSRSVMGLDVGKLVVR